MKKILTMAFLALLFFASPALADSYVIDPAHTQIGFSAKHMVITNVKGRFKEFSGGFDFNEKTKKLENAALDIAVKSIDTDVEKRDKHLRSPDFLNVEQFPKITFKQKAAGVTQDNGMWVTGDFTIRGVTREIRLEGEFLGAVTDFQGNRRAGFTATGEINRFDYGLNWNKLLELGGAIVSKKVKLILEVEGVRK
ncbi:MAG: YceI family protein [Nitrospinota bacterium]